MMQRTTSASPQHDPEQRALACRCPLLYDGLVSWCHPPGPSGAVARGTEQHNPAASAMPRRAAHAPIPHLFALCPRPHGPGSPGGAPLVWWAGLLMGTGSVDHILLPNQTKAGRSLTEKKKKEKVFRYQFSQKSPRALHVLNHGWWRLVAVGGWRELAVGGWWSLGAVLKGGP